MFRTYATSISLVRSLAGWYASNPNRSTIQAEVEVETEAERLKLKLRLNLNLKLRLKLKLKLGHVGNWHVCSHFDCNFFSLADSPLERVKFVLAIKSQRQWKTQIKIAVAKKNRRKIYKFSSRNHCGQNKCQADRRHENLQMTAFSLRIPHLLRDMWASVNLSVSPVSFTGSTAVSFSSTAAVSYHVTENDWQSD